MYPDSNGTDITRLDINTKLIPTISRGKNLREKIDLLTNKKAGGYCLGYIELRNNAVHESNRPTKINMIFIIN